MSNPREIIVMAPPPNIVDEIGERLIPTLAHVPHDLIEYRVNKRGRNTYLLVQVLVSLKYIP